MFFSKTTIAYHLRKEPEVSGKKSLTWVLRIPTLKGMFAASQFITASQVVVWSGKTNSTVVPSPKW